MVFSKISSQTIAAASLGQVYRATLRDSGEDVAIKVVECCMGRFFFSILSLFFFYFQIVFQKKKKKLKLFYSSSCIGASFVIS